MAEKTSLRDYQRELAERLRGAERGRAASKLGLLVGDESWLVDLADVAEVIPVPVIAPVSLTQAWFKGVANIRGNLYSVVDFPAFLGRGRVILVGQARLLLVAERFRLGTALLVDRSLGLRSSAQLRRREVGATARWSRSEYDDLEGRHWIELDVPQLVRHPEFLAVEI